MARFLLFLMALKHCNFRGGGET